MVEEIMVSICCLAYNHEAYIADALEGFVKQKTNFRIEVLIHDDASTDNTAQIIRQYEQKFPEIIKPIYQTQNQHRQGVKISSQIQFPRAKGKYIALCEGDDYWIDPLKLQKQVDYMEAHPECRLCFTNGRCERDGKRSRRVIPWSAWNRKAYKPGDTDYDMGEMALLAYVPTASLLFLREDILHRPALSPEAYTGDTFVRLYTTSLGYAHCIDEDTCIYRVGVGGSLTAQWNEEQEKKIRFYKRSNIMTDDMNRLTDYRYDVQLTEVKLRRESDILVLQGDKRQAWKKMYRRIYWRNSVAQYVHYFARVWLPGFYSFLHKMRVAVLRRYKKGIR